MRAPTVLLAVFAVLVVATAAVGAPTIRDPKTMVLRPADMPVDFKQTKTRYVSNTQASREASVKKNLTALGRVQGYEATYEKQSSKGILVVVSRASTYRTAAGARQSMALDVRGAKKARGLDFREVALASKLGDEARMYRATVRQNRTTVEVYTLAWRSGRVYAAVIGTGLAGTGKPFFVPKLARRQQARIAG